MSNDFVPYSHQTPAAGTALAVPALILEAGEQAAWHFLDFFTAPIPNDNTRAAYKHAVDQFLAWCQEKGLKLANIRPSFVAAYIKQLGKTVSVPTVKQHLAAIRMLFDWLVIGQILPFNPASSVRAPKYVVTKGKTPVLSAEEARQLLNSIDHEHDEDGRLVEKKKLTIAELRDRVLIGVMVYSFARISAAIGMDVEDYFHKGRRSWFRLHEKGGKYHEVPAHHNAQAYLDAYLEAAGIADDRKGPLLRSFNRQRQLTGRRLHRTEALLMIKRRARAAGLPPEICNHTFRATGITEYLRNGGSLENAQQIAAHSSPRTTKLYDHTTDEINLDEIEKIQI